MSVVNVSHSFVTKKQGQADRCHRCGGLMVREKVFEIGSFDWRCVSCGERIDPVILAHRQIYHPKELLRGAAENVFAGKGKARLN
jgi:hypothetical protein